ncbi:MAG: 50S ribosomal protein L17 [Deltaproteobacteria bacterium]|nr:50S ribosomal protein L17 [Deltaproteobacteria bacterium]
MRHRKAGKKLGRDSSHRKAVLRNLVTSLFRYEEISTTHAKAKALRPVAEKMITLAKRGDLHARRQVVSYFMDKSVANKLFDQMSVRFLDRQGGYVRILRAGHRVGDNAPLAIIQLLLADKGKGADKPIKREQKGAEKVPKKASDKQESPKSTIKVPEAEEEKDTSKGKKKASDVKKESPKRKTEVAEEKKDSRDKQGISKDKVKVAKRKQEKAEKP